MRFFKTACIVLALAASAGCQPTPTPFAHPRGTLNPAVSPLPDAPGIRVMDIEGLPHAQAAAAERAMTDALAANNIPAARTGGNNRTRFVIATASVEPAAAGARRVRAHWYLLGPDGALLGSHQGAATVSRGAWDEASRKSFRPLAEGAAARFAALVQEPPVRRAAPPAAEAKPTLHVWPIDGAPNGGNAVLRREMQWALRRRSYSVTDRLDDGALIVSGWVDVGAPKDGRQALSVSWSVLDSAGRELGTLAQRNAVSASQIDSGWPALAALIAESAAGGVSDLLRNLPRSTAGARRNSGG